MYIKATITSSTGTVTIVHQATRDGLHWQRLASGIKSPYHIHWDDQANQDIEWIQLIADKYGKTRVLTSNKWRNKI